MTPAKVTVRRWGASLGTVIPKPIVDQLQLKEGDEISIDVRKPSVGAELFGTLAHLKVDAQRAKDEMRKGW